MNKRLKRDLKYYNRYNKTFMFLRKRWYLQHIDHKLHRGAILRPRKEACRILTLVTHCISLSVFVC